MTYNFDTWVDRSGTSSIKWDVLKGRYGRDDVVPMWVADMDFASPQPVIDALVARAKHGVYGYTVRPDSYLNAIVDWLLRRHKWTVDKGWIAHSPGVVTALSVMVRAYTDVGDEIIIQPPVYHPFYTVIQQQGRELVLNPLRFDGRRYEMDFDHLESVITAKTKMLILCSPHNPTGRVWTADELRRLCDICVKHNVLVVSDEIHHDLVYKEFTHTPLGAVSPDFADHVITCIAPSKTFNLAGLQTSMVIIRNPELKKRYESALGNTFIGGANIFGMTACEAAYRQGDEWLDELLDYLHGNLDYLSQFIEEYVPEIKVIPPEGTYLVWLDCRELGLNKEDLDHFLIHEARLGLNEGHMFGPGGEGFQRMNIACPRPMLEKAMQQLEQAVAIRRPVRAK